MHVFRKQKHDLEKENQSLLHTKDKLEQAEVALIEKVAKIEQQFNAIKIAKVRLTLTIRLSFYIAT